MIHIKPEYKLSKDFKELVEFFNALEEQLEDRNKPDIGDILRKAERELVMWGKI